MSVHTPDICYRGAGFEEKNRQKLQAKDWKGEYFLGKFAKKDSPDTRELRVLWTWNANGLWQAPDNPRFSFAGSPILFKLYVIQDTFRGDTQAEENNRSFLNAFIPALEKSLLPKT